MRVIYHKVKINVADGSSDAVIDIPQGSANSHALVIQLHQNNRLFDITGLTPTINWYNENDDKVVTTEFVYVINAHRGQLVYIPALSLLNDFKRYVVVLRLKHSENDREIMMSFRFIVNVTKDNTYNPEGYEVTISDEFYKDLQTALDALGWKDI